MMESAVPKHLVSWFRPSRMLGFLLFIVPTIFLWLAVWKYYFPEYLLFGIIPAPVKLTKPNWLLLVGVVAAVMGWLVSSYITLRNSIKQHTINTLLQSRLSTHYQQQAQVINQTFFAPGMPLNDPVPLDFLLDEKNKDALGAVNYVLNYFEFCAVGIRYGDLDENLMRQTMRGIIRRLCNRMMPYIRYTRKEDENGKLAEPTTQFEHIKWLLTRWEK